MSEASREMPRYKCHKEVWALKIDELKPRHPDDGTLMLTPADSGYAPILLDAEFIAKHKPKVGGYFVVYKDGYRSFSPAEAFEEGYSKGTSPFTFHKSGMEPHAIVVFKAGTSNPATEEEIDSLLERLNSPGLDKRPAGK